MIQLSDRRIYYNFFRIRTLYKQLLAASSKIRSLQCCVRAQTTWSLGTNFQCMWLQHPFQAFPAHSPEKQNLRFMLGVPQKCRSWPTKIGLRPSDQKMEAKPKTCYIECYSMLHNIIHKELYGAGHFIFYVLYISAEEPQMT